MKTPTLKEFLETMEIENGRWTVDVNRQYYVNTYYQLYPIK